jgi:hypothetical protein
VLDSSGLSSCSKDHKFGITSHDIAVPKDSFEFGVIRKMPIANHPQLPIAAKHSMRILKHLPSSCVAECMIIMKGRVSKN